MQDNLDSFTAQLRGEFMDEATDILNSFDIVLGNLRSGQEKPEEGFRKLRMYAHSVKGSSSVAGFPLVQLVMHRLEDYIDGLKEITEPICADIVFFSEKARFLIEANTSGLTAAELSRQLPARRGQFDETQVALPEPVEVLLIIKEKTAGLLFEREMRNIGLRVNILPQSFPAFEMAVRTRPDYIVISGVLDELSGVDLACALAAMPATANIPVSLLTSMAVDSPEIKKLPKSVSIIRKNHFGEDLAAALKGHNIIYKP